MKIAYATQYNENSKWQHWEDKIKLAFATFLIIN